MKLYMCALSQPSQDAYINFVSMMIELMSLIKPHEMKVDFCTDVEESLTRFLQGDCDTFVCMPTNMSSNEFVLENAFSVEHPFVVGVHPSGKYDWHSITYGNSKNYLMYSHPIHGRSTTRYYPFFAGDLTSWPEVFKVTREATLDVKHTAGHYDTLSKFEVISTHTFQGCAAEWMRKKA